MQRPIPSTVLQRSSRGSVPGGSPASSTLGSSIHSRSERQPTYRHSPAWQASKTAQLPSSSQGVSQRPWVQIWSNEQSTPLVHSTHFPSSHSGVEPKHSAAVSQSLGS